MVIRGRCCGWPEIGHAEALVDGRAEIVLSNTQILRGKLDPEPFAGVRQRPPLIGPDRDRRHRIEKFSLTR